MAPTAIGKVMRALKPKPLVQAAARRAGAELLAAAVGEAGPARLLAAAGGWLAACVAALRPGEDAAVQRGTWRALAALFERLGALAGAPGASCPPRCRSCRRRRVRAARPARPPTRQGRRRAADRALSAAYSVTVVLQSTWCLLHRPEMRSCCAAQTMLP